MAGISVASYKGFTKQQVVFIAQANMFDIATAAEAFYSQNNSYIGFKIEPKTLNSKVAKNYNIQIQTTINAFTIIAVANNQQIAQVALWLNNLGEQRKYATNAISGSYEKW